jgi:hypothetical protein
MAKIAGLRVNFDNAPASVLKTLFGDAKDKNVIMMSIHDLGQQPVGTGKNKTTREDVHVQEIFHYVNTDEKGQWNLNDAGEPAIGLQSLNRQLSALVNTGEVERVGDRTSRYKLSDAGKEELTGMGEEETEE